MAKKLWASRGLGCGCSLTSHLEKESVVPFTQGSVDSPIPTAKLSHIRFASPSLLGSRLNQVGSEEGPQHLGLPEVDPDRTAPLQPAPQI